MGFTTDQAKMLQGQQIDIANAVPSHEVAISKWMWFGKTEVTQQQWEAVMRFNRAQGPKRHEKYPAFRLSWTEAVDFCSRLSRAIGATVRLPSEAEWEYACRAGSDGLWSFGSDADKLKDYARCRENLRIEFPFSTASLTEAGAKTKANQWGLHDMHGSVWEWCSDWYGDSDEPWGSPSPYTSNSKQDPSGPTPLNIEWVERGGVRRPTLDGRLLYRVMRGGDYRMGQVYSASRSKGVENEVKFSPMRGHEKLVGVRVVLEADAKPEQ